MYQSLTYIYTNFGVYRLVWDGYRISKPLQGFPEDAKQEIEILYSMPFKERYAFLLKGYEWEEK